MQFTLLWLKKFLDTDAGSEEICNALTAIGLEVEELVDNREKISCFKVAEIIDVIPHPKADKLNICRVDNGTEVLQVICGANNVAPKMKIVLASVGDVIPINDLKIEKRQLRGIESNGMICSAAELGLDDQSEGIMELPYNLTVGEKLIEQIPELADEVIEISLTPNRGDCLGVYGIARDLAAYGVGKLKPKEKALIKSTISSNINVEVDNANLCPLYVSRYFSDVTNKISSINFASVLRAIKEKSISVVVDITNYLMFSYNRPMHIYDADKIVGALVVRNAKNGERFVALNGQEYVLDSQDLVVADDNKICSLAGIIGGEESKCDLETKNILLEVAIFDKKTITRTARRLNIETASKHRNERGLDYNFTIDAVDITSKKIIELCGGQAGDIKIVGSPKQDETVIEFDISKIVQVTGLNISKDKVISILETLGFIKITEKNNIIIFTVPSWRHDISIAEDIVEEVVRIYGYENLDSKPMDDYFTYNSELLEDHKRDIQIKKILSANGYNELVTWSFMSSKTSEKFGLSPAILNIANPISDNLNQLRYSIIPNLLQAVKSNKQRSFENLAFFELGPVYQATQRKCLAAIRAGFNKRDSLYSDKRAVDFFDLKNDMLNSLTVFGIRAQDIRFEPQDSIEWYHPGKSAVVRYKNHIIGYIGEIHPTILKSFKISGSVVALELFFEDIPFGKDMKKYIHYSDYQIVEKDIAFVIEKELAAGKIEEIIYSLNNEFIKDLYIFDVYTDEEQLGKNKKSVAIKLILQSNDKTLNKEDIDNIFNDITHAVEDKLEGKLRTF